MSFVKHTFLKSLKCLIRIEVLLAALAPSIALVRFFDVEFKAPANVFFIWHTFGRASCTALLCKWGGRRIVMTLALWLSRWVEFKHRLHIRAPVTQKGPVPGLKRSEPAVWPCLCAHMCLRVAKPKMGVGCSWKDQSVQPWCSAEQPAPLHTSLLVSS